MLGLTKFMSEFEYQGKPVGVLSSKRNPFIIDNYPNYLVGNLGNIISQTPNTLNSIAINFQFPLDDGIKVYLIEFDALLINIAGEDYINAGVSETAIEALEQMEGLIILIDRENTEFSLSEQWRYAQKAIDLFKEIKKSSKVDIPIAFVFSKRDLYTNITFEALEEEFNHSFSLLIAQLKRDDAPFALFSCSATGGTTPPEPYGFKEILEFFSEVHKGKKRKRKKKR